MGCPCRTFSGIRLPTHSSPPKSNKRPRIWEVIVSFDWPKIIIHKIIDDFRKVIKCVLFQDPLKAVEKQNNIINSPLNQLWKKIKWLIKMAELDLSQIIVLRWDVSRTLVCFSMRQTSVPTCLTPPKPLRFLSGCGRSSGLDWPHWVSSVGCFSASPPKRWVASKLLSSPSWQVLCPDPSRPVLTVELGFLLLLSPINEVKILYFNGELADINEFLGLVNQRLRSTRTFIIFPISKTLLLLT